MLLPSWPVNMCIMTHYSRTLTSEAHYDDRPVVRSVFVSPSFLVSDSSGGSRGGGGDRDDHPPP